MDRRKKKRWIMSVLKLLYWKDMILPEHGYREKFQEARPEGHENPSQFIFRLKNYFTKWIELAEVEQTLMGVVDLIVREQFTGSCSKNLSILLKQSSPKTLHELSRLADQYLAARNQKLLCKEVIKRDSPRASVKDNHSGFLQRVP